MDAATYDAYRYGPATISIGGEPVISDGTITYRLGQN